MERPLTLVIVVLIACCFNKASVSQADESVSHPKPFANTSGQYPITVYQSGDNGPSGSIARLAEDQFGRIYAAGGTGIWRFDGIRWNQLACGHCMTLCFDGQKHMYAIVDGVLGRWQIDEEYFSDFTPLTDSLATASADLEHENKPDLNTLTNAPSLVGGSVYFVGHQHLIRLRHEDGRDHIKVWSAADLPGGLRFEGVRGWRNRTIAWFRPQTYSGEGNRLAEIFPDGSMTFTDPLWTTEDKPLDGQLVGLNTLPGPDGQDQLVLIHRNKFAFLSDLTNPVVNISVPKYNELILHLASTDIDGGIAIKTDNHGLLFLDSAANIDVHIPGSEITLTSHQIFTDSFSRVWLAGYHSVLRIDPNHRLLQWQNHQAPNPRHVIHFDNHVILAHSQGISVAQANPRTGLPMEPFRAIQPARHAQTPASHQTRGLRKIGDTLFLSQVQCLYALNSLDDYRERKESCLSRGYFVDLVGTGDDDVAVALRYGAPAFKLIRRNGQWEKGDELGCFQRPAVGALCDSDNCLWLAATQYALGRRSIQRVNLDSGDVDTFKCQVASPKLLQFAGRIFYAGAESQGDSSPDMFYEFNPQTSQFEPTKKFADIESRLKLDDRQSDLRSCRTLPNGTLEFTFTDLFVLNATPQKDGGWKLKSVLPSTPSATAFSSYRDDFGNLWMTAGRHVYCCSQAADGRNHQSRKVVPQLVVNAVNRNRQSFRLSESPSGNRRLKVSHSDASLGFQFSMPSSGSSVRTDLYRYRLLGQYDEWSDWDRLAEVRFPGLPDGDYTLQIQGLRNYEQSTPIRSIGLQIAPPWFRSFWFRMSLALATTGCVILAFRLRRRSQRKLAAAIEHERNRLRQSRRHLEVVQDAHLERKRDSGIQEVSGRIAHEVGNILTPVAIYGEELAAGRVPQSQLRRYGTAICEAALNAAESTRRAHPIYRERTASLRMEAVDQIVHRVADKARKLAAADPERRIRIQTDTTPMSAVVSTADIEEVLLNLVLNGMEAIRDEGTVLLTCEQQDGQLIMEVRDDGVGMTEEVLAECRRSFFTTKETTGKGLGLSVSQVIAAAYNGRLEIESTAGEGSCVRVVLPESQSAAVEPSETYLKPSYRILVVDAVFRTRDAIRHQLELMQHEVVDVESPEDAFDQLAKSSFDVITTDAQFAETSGMDFSRQLRASGFEGAVIFIVGSQQPELLNVCDRLLMKPVTTQQLREAISALTIQRDRSLTD